jgi:hypothetical protein
MWITAAQAYNNCHTDIVGLQWKLNSKDLLHQIIVPHEIHSVYVHPFLRSSYVPEGPVQMGIKYMVKYVHAVSCTCVRHTL